ncbi:MAG: VCBS repeat-containing protein [Acidobacteria bacterium]|nr:VCBS repeat-containing protein [Acidobacteriota bacterium]
MPTQLHRMSSDNRNRWVRSGIPLWIPSLAMFAMVALIFVGKVYCQSAEPKWQTHGFDGFRSGTFDSSGANLYVSRQGNLETIHSLDVNSDGYIDVLFNNTHDIAYVVPAYEYDFHDRDKPTLKTYPGPGSVRVRASDLNGDGHPELVIARGFDDTTRVMNSWVYWGSDKGWTANRHQELLTPYAQDLCIGDLNGDGKKDLIFIASWPTGSNKSIIYWGTDDVFRPLNASSINTPGATSCLSADIDGDGKDDLLITGMTKGAEIFWGRSGAFQDQPRVLDDAPKAVGASFIQGHLVLGTDDGPLVYAVKGKSIHLEQQMKFTGSSRVAVQDLNGDQIPDLVVARSKNGSNWRTESRIYWGKNRPNGSLFDESDITKLPTMGAVDVAVADLDKDGHPDLIFANSRTYESYDIDSYVYWGSSNGYSVDWRTKLPTHGAASVSVEGTSVYFANGMTGGPIGRLEAYAYLGGPGGKFSTDKVLRLPTVGGYESCAADLNDDGFTDLVLEGSHEGDLNGPEPSTIFWGNAQGLSKDRSTTVPTRGSIGCAIGELNRDGYLDLVFTNMDDGTVALFYGGADHFSHPVEHTLHVSKPRFPAIADLNKDGYQDLLIPLVDDGLWIFWGSPAGYSQDNHTVLPGMGTVSEQVADLNNDGYLDIVLCNLYDPGTARYHGVNSYIYWGSQQGYRATNRSELPSLGAHHAVIEDFNRDGALDIFISNYQSEFTRDLNSSIYWGNSEGSYTAAHSTPLHVGSAAGVLAADLDGDGWIDLAVSNHVVGGDHHTRSPIFWNSSNGFLHRPITWLPTIGPHMMAGVDDGNLYTRRHEESYVSVVHQCKSACRPQKLSWEGRDRFGSFIDVDIRGVDTEASLSTSPWDTVCSHCSKSQQIEREGLHRFWQYRIMFHTVATWSSVVTSVNIDLDNNMGKPR